MTTEIIAVDDLLLAHVIKRRGLYTLPREVLAMAVELQAHRTLHAGDTPLHDRIATLIGRLRNLADDLTDDGHHGDATETRDIAAVLDQIADDIEGVTP